MKQARRPRLFGAASVFIGLLVLVALNPSGAAAAVGTDLSITKSDNPDPLTAGNDITYTIQVQNQGPNNASNVVVTDSLPVDVDFVSATGGICQIGDFSEVSCELGQVNAGTTATLTIVVKTKTQGTILNHG
jgi:uncharacterized repeat protein (TIGR01451 family)